MTEQFDVPPVAGAVPPVPVVPVPVSASPELPRKAFVMEPLPEAGGIAYCEMFTEKGVKINLTGRGHTAAEAADNLVDGIMHAASKYKWVADPAKLSRPAPTQYATPPPPTSYPAGAPVPAVAAVVSGVMHSNKMESKPRPDGRVDLGFFDADKPQLKYAEINACQGAADLVKILQGVGSWTPAHFAAAATYPVDYDIHWVASTNTKKSGEPYKNIVSVTPHK